MHIVLLLSFFINSLLLNVWDSAPHQVRKQPLSSSQIKINATIDSLNEAAFTAKYSNLDTAFALLDEAYRLATQQGYQKGIAVRYLYEGGIYQQYNFTKKALSLYYQALEVSRAANDTFNIARANQQIANALLQNGNLTEAERLYQEAMHSYSTLGYKEDIINIVNSLGLVKLQQNELKIAKAYFERALLESELLGYSYGLKKANYNMGQVYLKKKNLPLAKKYLQVAYALDEKRGDKYGLAQTKSDFALIALQEKKYEEAGKWALAALNDAQAVKASAIEIKAMESMLAVHRQLQDHKQIIVWQDKLIQKQKQVFEQGNSYALDFSTLLKEIQEAKMRNELQTQEAAQKQLLTRSILSVVALALVLLAFLALMWFKNYKKARAYGNMLAIKNEAIEKSARELDTLNRTIAKQNKSLEESNLMKDKLFTIVSHDMRSPLTSLKGLLNLVQVRPMSPEEIKRMFGMLQREVDVVLGMLSNLLDWSKTQLDGAAVVVENISLHSLAEANLAFVSSQAHEKKISLENKVPAMAVALADQERLNFIVRNLVLNAIKFTSEGGIIAVDAKVSQNQVILSVRDNGRGIAPHNIGKLFSDTVRFTTLGTAREKGTGLGLKFCKDLAESMGGSINVSSVENVGSTFFVTLPAAPFSVQLNQPELMETV
ncbi:tetratricopeptide repeat-containing sensor histidine kinase [Pontibacter arcticus]|uniref:histidine kinase n=1 Tax=Pontibacter arcticus TaxID=2080288 RepID=A0A364REW7_9BACT|nr:tetratricopeptide repeat-containing sensor histidine kinase [Pontibacter arcticus]RAU82839.1 hypothetical protein DP923_06190 [Pontibacter arcticus]